MSALRPEMDYRSDAKTQHGHDLATAVPDFGRLSVGLEITASSGRGRRLQYSCWVFYALSVGLEITTRQRERTLGTEGMPRRYADYVSTDGFTTLNTISTIGSFLLGASMLPFLWNVWYSLKHGELVGADDPWGYGNSLELATSCCHGRQPSLPCHAARWPHAQNSSGSSTHSQRGSSSDPPPRS